MATQFDPDSVAVVGAGTMGHGIATVFASEGYDVGLYDQDEGRLETAHDHIRESLSQLDDHDRLGVELETARNAVSSGTDLEAVIADVDLVIEAVTEELDVKRTVFETLSDLTDSETVLSTNTSGLSITEIAAATDAPDRVLGTHWFNPPHIVPLVEVVKGEETDDDLAAAMTAFLDDLGKTAITVEKDVPGFIGNRIQMAMCYEAFSLLDRGIASAEDIDKAVKAGFGFRLPSMGIFEKVDQSGIDVHYAIESYLMPELDRGTDPNPVVSELVEQGDFGLKTGEGIYDWTDADPDAVVADRDAYLLAQLEQYESNR
ncbi:3-hydroxyacyl-CoA dehydrogenase NAD-binding domain-containing protein (plasmid) [Natrinema zhouii]|uniref:3-hydroxyacyl-CoA dehydrogenase family protein n=1 Tax=Natrinema zhouii TaxID=1710539 RepID=UPI001CFF6B8B|nr:3-hydroxyacyl-CoA dehydrogenase NAD-binding domain-containing protein [Natrinema zhouii]UHQ98768.1 3-hydroxyacyl-CoA dehydrogenase NAD-binding domain-containing protein [Natrinema zhouii]